MSAAFTPGPWKPVTTYADAQRGAVAIAPWAAQSEPVATLCTKHGRPIDEQIANARLIAAAPEMHEALKACADWMEEHGCVPPCLSDARSALAKAQGGGQ